MNDRATCEAVFWDIGGVLLDVESARASHRRFVEVLAAEYDLAMSAEEAVQTWRTTVGRHFRERDGTAFRSSHGAYGLAVDEVVGEPVPADAWAPLFERAQRGTLQPNSGAVETVERLADAGYHVGIVSDIDDDEARLILECFGLSEIFHSVTTSESVGRTKPHPAMFKTALGKADVSQTDALMVGDRYKHDMAGAADAGMQTVAYGAEDGPAVDYRVNDLTEILTIVGLEQ